MSTFILLWCEYDLGQENFVFVSELAAYNWIKRAFERADFDFSWEEFLDEQLFGYIVVNLVKE